MSSVSQEQRLLTVETPQLSSDVFILNRFDGTESISALFQFDLSLLSHRNDLEAKDIVGHPITVTLRIEDGSSPVRFNGFVNQMVAQSMNAEGLRQYQISMVPSLWLLTKSEHNRIFQNLSSIDIIEEVLADFSSEIEFELNVKTSDYIERETCTQYRESDFNFISRLMEEEGVFYYFRQEKNKCIMVICDTNKGFMDCEPGFAEFNDKPARPSGKIITEWIKESNFHAGAFYVTDYNDSSATVDYSESTKTKNDLPKSSKLMQTEHAYFKYKKGEEQGTHAFDKSYNKMLADRLMEMEELAFNICRGSSYCHGFCAGGRFELEHPMNHENGKYIITQLHHSASDGNQSESYYHNSFTVIPAIVPFRSPHRAVNTLALGPQTAVVTETNQVRCLVKVKYFWTDTPSDCWVRVSQLMAGAQQNEQADSHLGIAQFVPSVGEEVIVDFLQGNMDRPIVKGSLYNSSQVSNGLTVGNYQNFAGFESHVGARMGLYDADSESTSYLAADTVRGKAKKLIRFESAESIEVESKGTKNEKIKKNRTSHIGQTDKLKVGGDSKLKVDKNIVAIAGEDMSYEAGMSLSCTAGTEMSHTAGTDMAFEASTGITLKTGMSSIEMTPSSIELKVGGSSIKLDPAGVTIKGLMVKIDGSVSVEIKGGAMAKLEAGGMTTLKGGIMMIN